MGIIKLTEEKVSKLIELYGQGLSAVEIAPMVNLSSPYIIKLLKLNNVERRTGQSYKKKLNPEQLKEVIELYSQGQTTEEIAKVFKVSSSCIARTLKRNNVERRVSHDYKKPKPRKIFAEQTEIIVKSYKEGISALKISKKLKVANQTVLRVLRKNNVEIRKFKNPDSERKEPRVKTCFQKKLNESQELNAVKLYKKGISLSNIAEVFNVSRSTINEIIEKNNLEKKGPGYYGKKINSDQEFQVLSLYSQGLTVKDIGKQFEVDQVTISSVLKKHGVYIIPVEERVRKFNQEQEKEIVQLYNKGETIKDIAAMYEVSSTPITRILKENNIEIRQHPFLKCKNYETKIKKSQYPKLIKLYQSGQSMTDLAKQFQVTSQTISRILRKKNILIRPGKFYATKLSPQEHKQIIVLYKKGASSNKIAEQFGVNPGTIIGVLKKHKVKLRETVTYHIKLSSEQKAEALKLRKQGLSFQDIAEKIGIDENVIMRAIYKTRKIDSNVVIK
jgi:transposase